ncbi:hypothetical protein HK104_006724 [Borealophlyctis nickersoniae]|nr:hypothetical protein HK104_006724 [Borealophlyctis nickersoniae]
MAFYDSLDNVFKNASLCSQEQRFIASRTTFKGNVAAACAKLNESPGCIQAAALEKNNCGFGDSSAGVSQASTYCSNGNTDPCCSLLPSDGRLAAIAGGVGGSVFGIIAIAVSFYIIYQSRRSGNRNSSSSFTTPPPMGDGDRFGSGVPIIPTHTTKPPPAHQRTSALYNYPTSITNTPTTGTPPRNTFFNSLKNTLTRSPSRASSQYPPPAQKHSRSNSVASKFSVRSDSYGMHAALDQEDMPQMPVFYKAIATEGYEGEEDDEVAIGVGDVVCVYRVFEDGWGWGVNSSTGKKGVFPVVCLSEL